MISLLILLIAGLGLLFLLLLFRQLRALSQELKLKRHRGKEAGLADLLNYAALVDEGVILGKNGAFMAAWLYKSEDQSGSSDSQREVLSFHINQALVNLGSGWMIHVDAVRREAPIYSEANLSHFPDPLSKAIDEERRRFFQSLGTLYEGFFVLTLTWLPPRLAQRKLVELMFDDEAIKPGAKVRSVQLIEQFQRECQSIENRLSACFSLERLKANHGLDEHGADACHDDFLRWLQFCLTGINQPMLLPKVPIYLDALLGGQELWSGVIPKIGRHFIQCVAIEGFPLESQPGLLNSLAELPLSYRWSSRFIFMDAHEAVSHLDKFRKKWQQKVRGFFSQLFNTRNGVIDKDAIAMVEDAADGIAETNSRLIVQGYYTSVVVLMSEDRESLEKASRYIEKAIHGLGFAARTETLNTLEAFFGSLPGHGVENVRRPLLNSLNLADLLPTSSLWTGENKAPSPLFSALSPALMHCITSGNSPFRLNLHVRDLGHCLMFGPTRSGKSTHLAFIAVQWRRYLSARIFAFDKGLSMLPTCKAVGGSHYKIAANEEPLAFAPLQFLATREDRAWAMEWLDTIFALNEIKTTAAQRNEIAKAVVTMHQSGSKTLSELSLLLQDEELREALKLYTVDGLMGHLLDAETDGLALADFMTFEIESLMSLGEKFALPVLLYLFRRIEASLDGKPTLIILDEAWLMLAHPVFCAKIQEWLVSMAKKNCSVVMATQQLSHAFNSGILDVLIESTATKIFLPNPHAAEEHTASMYARFGLNPRQIELIATAVPKRDYYYVSELGQRLYRLALGPLSLAFVGATDKESIAKIEALERVEGPNWTSAWLKEKGLNLEEYGGVAC